MFEFIKNLFANRTSVAQVNVDYDQIRKENEKKMKDEINERSMEVLKDFTYPDGKYAFCGKPWGAADSIHEIDGVNYYFVKTEEGQFKGIYAINSDITRHYRPGSMGTAANIPFIEWRIIENEGKKNLVVNELHTYDFQNIGLGTLLIQRAIKEAKENHCNAITGMLSFVDVRKNDDSIDGEKKAHRHHFYEKNGFIVNENDNGIGNFYMKL